MSGKQSFLGGVFLLSAAMFICKFIAFFNNIILVNIPEFGNAGLALYVGSTDIYLVILAITTMGVPGAIAKLVSEKLAVGDSLGAHRIFRTSFSFLAVVGLVAAVILILLSGFITDLVQIDVQMSVISLAPTVFFATVMAVYRGYFQGMEDMRPQAISQVIEQVFKLIFSVLLIYPFLKLSLSAAAAGATFGTTAGAVLGTVYLTLFYRKRRHAILKEIQNSKPGFKIESRRTIIRNLISTSIPMSLGSIIATLSSLVDLITIMRCLEIAGISSETATDLFGQLGKVQQLVNFPIAINMSISTAIIPAIASARVVGNKDLVKERVTQALRLTFIIGLPSAVGMSILAEPLVSFLFPGAPGGGHILRVLAFTIIFMALSQSLTGILQGLNKIYVPATGMLIGAIVKLIINLLLVSLPSVNIVGAAVASIFCYVASSATSLTVLQRVLKMKFNWRDLLLKPATATIIMGIGTRISYGAVFAVVERNVIALLLSILISMIIFFVLLLRMGAITYSDFKVIPRGEKLGSFLMGKGWLKGQQ